MLGEIHERLLEAVEIVAVGFHVVLVDIGNDRQNGIEHQEGSVGLVRLGNQEITRTEACIGSCSFQSAADHEGRIHAGLGQDAGDEAGCCGLAMGAGDGNALLEAHQFSQHHGARYDGRVVFTCGDHFRVVVLDGG